MVFEEILLVLFLEGFGALPEEGSKSLAKRFMFSTALCLIDARGRRDACSDGLAAAAELDVVPESLRTTGAGAAFRGKLIFDIALVQSLEFHLRAFRAASAATCRHNMWRRQASCSMPGGLLAINDIRRPEHGGSGRILIGPCYRPRRAMNIVDVPKAGRRLSTGNLHAQGCYTP